MFISVAYSVSGIRVLIIVGVIQAMIDVYWCCVFCFWNKVLITVGVIQAMIDVY